MQIINVLVCQGRILWETRSFREILIWNLKNHLKISGFASWMMWGRLMIHMKFLQVCRFSEANLATSLLTLTKGTVIRIVDTFFGYPVSTASSAPLWREGGGGVTQKRSSDSPSSTVPAIKLREILTELYEQPIRICYVMQVKNHVSLLYRRLLKC